MIQTPFQRFKQILGFESVQEHYFHLRTVSSERPHRYPVKSRAWSSVNAKQIRFAAGDHRAMQRIAGPPVVRENGLEPAAHGVDEGDILLARSEVNRLRDEIFVLQCAVEDADRDMTREA
jgi:hypothetical protein